VRAAIRAVVQTAVTSGLAFDLGGGQHGGIALQPAGGERLP
jgi:hypothetical protein